MARSRDHTAPPPPYRQLCQHAIQEEPMSTEAAPTTRPSTPVESEQGLLLFVLVMVILGVAGMFLVTA
jgi:hypothetical protein